MIILYVPFTLDESIIDMADRAKRWVNYYRENYTEQEREIPVIVYYKKETTTKEQKDDIEQAMQDGTAKIYILAHGLDTEALYVANVTEVSDPEFDKVIEIDEVANRFAEDFIQDHEFSQSNIIKLYFCDPYVLDNKAKRMAQIFHECLPADSIPQSHIQYYSGAKISGPVKTIPEVTQALYDEKESGTDNVKKEKKGKKFAAKNINLSCCNGLISVSIDIIGNASLFRHTLGSPSSDEKTDIDLLNVNPMYRGIMREVIREIEGIWEFNPQLAKRKNNIISEIINGLSQIFDSMLAQIVNSDMASMKSKPVSNADPNNFFLSDTEKESDKISVECKGTRGLPVKIETTKENIITLLDSYQSALNTGRVPK